MRYAFALSLALLAALVAAPIAPAAVFTVSSTADLADASASETVRLRFRKHGKSVRKIKALLRKGGKRARKRAKATIKASATSPGAADAAKLRIKLR